LATIAQWIFSYIYGTTTFALLAFAVTVLALIVNFAFQIWFYKEFNTKKLPYDIERRIRLFKMTEAEGKKHKVDRDPKFTEHKQKHKCMSAWISMLTATVNFKFNKCYYSRFYDLDPFYSQFTQAKYYRKMMTWY
jgi:hypothetical protein